MSEQGVGIGSGLVRLALGWRLRHLLATLGVGLLLGLLSPRTRGLGVGLLVSSWLWDYLAYRIRAADRAQRQGSGLQLLLKQTGVRAFYLEGREHTVEYPNAATPFGERRVTAVSPVHYLRRERVRDLLGRVGVPGVRRHLDLGCKDGMVSADLQERGTRTVGVDLDAVALARYRARTGAHAIQADVGHLPFTAACVDTAALLEVIEHLEEPECSLAEARRALRAGGFLFLSTNNRSGLLLDHLANPLILAERSLGLYFPALLPPAQVLWESPSLGLTFYHTEFARTDLLALLRQAGLRPTRLETYYFLPGLDGWLGRILPRLTEAAYARWAMPIEKSLGHLPFLGWLGNNWIVVAQPASMAPRTDRAACVSA